jgi:hypothetical protein
LLEKRKQEKHKLNFKNSKASEMAKKKSKAKLNKTKEKKNPKSKLKISKKCRLFKIIFSKLILFIGAESPIILSLLTYAPTSAKTSCF